MALPVVGVDLDRMAHQLGRGVVLVRSNGKARHDLGLAGLPRPYYSGSHSAYALDRAGVGRETALAFWQRRYVRACGVDLGGYVVHVVGTNLSRTLLVERDHAQGTARTYTGLTAAAFQCSFRSYRTANSISSSAARYATR